MISGIPWGARESTPVERVSDIAIPRDYDAVLAEAGSSRFYKRGYVHNGNTPSNYKTTGGINMLRVLVNGADGRMGSQVVKAVFEDPELTVAGGVSITHVGEDVGEVAGVGIWALPSKAILPKPLRISNRTSSLILRRRLSFLKMPKPA